MHAEIFWTLLIIPLAGAAGLAVCWAEGVIHWPKRQHADVSEKVQAVIRDIESNPSAWRCESAFNGNDLFHRVDRTVRTEVYKSSKSIIHIKGMGQFYTNLAEHDALVAALERWRNQQVKLAMTTEVKLLAADQDAAAAWRKLRVNGGPKSMSLAIREFQDGQGTEN